MERREHAGEFVAAGQAAERLAAEGIEADVDCRNAGRD
jgi:hypothetical protein